MAKIDLPENWESNGDTIFVENRYSESAFIGVFMLIFGGFFLFGAFEMVREILRDYSDDAAGVILIPGGIGAVFFGIGLKTILDSRVIWRWEINLADKRFMLKKIRGSQTKVRWDRDLGGEVVLKIIESGDDNFTIRFEGPDWKETLWHYSWGYSRTRGFAESLSDAIGIELVDERRRGLSEDSEAWWEEAGRDSEPEERMDMRMATRDPDSQIDESVVEGRIRLKGNSKMLGQTMIVVVVLGLFFAFPVFGFIVDSDSGEWWVSYDEGYCEWEGDTEAVEEGEDARWYCKYAEQADWDTWWFYCELHGLDWRCTDDFGQSEDYQNSDIFGVSMIVPGGGSNANEPMLLFAAILPVILLFFYFFLTMNDAWTTVTIHDDKLAFGRLAPIRINSFTYKEISKSSISAIGLERIWHEDNDND
ncbi:MAG: hypothetical protein VX779_01310 [Candidatus Thermoplasmatota archaeon]|nr:hypothetical protein [Candidatus Thermoplasmatota archaeon]